MYYNEYVEFKETTYFNTYNMVAINDFRDFKTKDISTCMTISEISNYVDINNKLNKTCFEVLKNDILRIFLDLENIETDKPELYKQIIKDFITYTGLNLDTTKYIITLNEGSHHPGLSYHVIFHVITTMKNLRNTVMRFKQSYKDYEKYVDSSIYTSTRLFRLPYQYGCIQTNTKYPEDYTLSKDIHKIIEKVNIENDNIENYIIQHIEPSCNTVFSRMYRPIPNTIQTKDLNANVNTNNTNGAFSGPHTETQGDSSFLYKSFVNIFNSLNPFK